MAERPEDLNLPNTVISRIVKDALPSGVNVSKDARLAISKAASVFVLYATSCANNFAMNAKRKTISPQDVLEAMKEMEFDRFIEKLKECLEAYKKEQKEKKSNAEQRKKERVDEVGLEMDVAEIPDDDEIPDTDDSEVQFVVTTQSDDVIVQ